MASFSKFVDTFKLVVSIIPTMVEAVRTVESLTTKSGMGSEKLELVRKMLESTYSITGDIGRSFEEMWPALQKVVSSIVALFNKSGEFSKQ